MALQKTDNKFGKERAQRYKSCMDRCPTARYLEILPLLAMVSGTNTGSLDMVDIASGTGYLADFFEGIAKSVLRVDKSEEMLKKSGSSNYMVADMSSISDKIGIGKADFITCLAAFHHSHCPENPDPEITFAHAGTRHFSPERHLDIEESLLCQFNNIRDWVRILRPGGMLCLIDLPGYPDPAWDNFWINKERHKINTKGYFSSISTQLASWKINASANTLKKIITNCWGDFFSTDPHMETIQSTLTRRFSMKQLVDTYPLSDKAIKSEGPMVPADFFDDVVDGYGLHRHFGFFLRETSIKEALVSAGMQEIHVCASDPLAFQQQKEAAWFVHELFGIGETWNYNNIPKQELAELIRWLNHYLGFYEDQFGRTMLYWQLCYCCAVKQD